MWRKKTLLNANIPGLLFKFVNFLYNRSDNFNRELKVTLSEKIFFFLSYAMSIKHCFIINDFNTAFS